MINALVVDDERMVRKGLQTLTDWGRFDMTFIGEAKDGYQALHFLTKQPVDIMFVDITMPNMNGFELIKQVQLQYPDVSFVILTCHHEFDYVQEALQLGAIDYIVKTLLNRNNVDETAARIISRLKREKEKQILEQFAGGVYLVKHDHMSKATVPKHIAHVEVTEQIIRLERSVYGELTVSERALLLKSCYIVQLQSSQTVTDAQAEQWLTQHFHTYRFYAPKEDEYYISDEQFISLIAASHQMNNEQKHVKWEEQLEQYRWLILPQEWSKWKLLTLHLQPDPSKLTSFVEQMYTRLVLTLQWKPDEMLITPLTAPTTSCWSDVEQWLIQLSLHLRERMTELSFSCEVVICMIKSIQLMHRQLGMELNQNEIAYEVGMSRSYFSQCFKRFFGVPFGEVLRQLRIETAKQLLLSTHQSISEIAHSIGFDDHKYFSRTFKTQLGMYPTEYRALHFVSR